MLLSLLPYDESLDHISVYLSQEVLVVSDAGFSAFRRLSLSAPHAQWLACSLYPGQIHRLGSLLVLNDAHRDYNRNYAAVKAIGGFFGPKTRAAVFRRLPDYALEECVDVNLPSDEQFWTRCRKFSSRVPRPEDCNRAVVLTEPE